MVPLSILDLSPVSANSTAGQALRNSLDLARHADGLGFRRYWVAEHHNLPAIASSAPDIMIGQIAAVTKNLRVGAGGVMLPNHAPLMVAERFKVLEALYPGRIDLGLGRAPGPRPRNILCASPPAGHQRRRRFPRPLQRADADGNPRLPRRPSVSQCARDAGRCAAAADLSARLLRLQRPACGTYRRGVFLRASFRRLPCGASQAALSGPPPAVGLARAAFWGPRNARGVRGYRCRSRTAGFDRRPQFRAPGQGRISAAVLAGRSRGLRLHSDRPRTYRAEPRAGRGRLTSNGKG